VCNREKFQSFFDLPEWENRFDKKNKEIKGVPSKNTPTKTKKCFSHYFFISLFFLFFVFQKGKIEMFKKTFRKNYAQNQKKFPSLQL